MQQPGTFSYVAPVEWEGEPASSPEVAWVGAEIGSIVRDRSAAAVFVHKLWTTAAEDTAIELATDELNGGMESTIDLGTGISNASHAIRLNARRILADREGPPPVEEPRKPGEEPTPEERAASAIRAKKLEAIITEIEARTVPPSDGPERALWRGLMGLQRMQALRDRQRIAAGWRITLVSAPDGWIDFASIRLADVVKGAIVGSHNRARRAAEEAAGK